MSLGNVLGGVATSAIATNDALAAQQRANQAAADAHDQQMRIQAAQHDADMAQQSAETAATAATAPPAPTAIPPQVDQRAAPTAPTADIPAAPAAVPNAPQAFSAPHATNALYTPTPQDRDAMTRAIMTEAGGEPLLGQVAVGHVILNRVANGYGGAKTIAGVVHAPDQFEGMSSGHAGLPVTDPAYLKAQAVADSVLGGKTSDPTSGAVNFINPTLQASEGRNQPAWAPAGQGQRIGNHVFYGGNGVSGSAPAAGAAPTTPGFIYPRDPNAYDAADDTAPTDPAGQKAHVYLSPDGSTHMVTYSPKFQTVDTAAEAGQRAAAAVYAARGDFGTANGITAGIDAAHKAAREDRLGDITVQHGQLLDRLSHVTTAGGLDTVYNTNGLTDPGTYVRSVVNPDKSVSVFHYSNDDPSKPLSVDHLAAGGANGVSGRGIEGAVAEIAAQIAKPEDLMTAIDAHSQIMSQARSTNAQAAYDAARARKVGVEADAGEAENAAGLPSATVAGVRATAEAQTADAHMRDASTAAQVFNNTTNTQIRAINQKIADPATPEPARATLRAQLTGLNGTLQNVPFTYQDNGMPKTGFNTPSGEQLATGRDGNFYPIGQEMGVTNALKAAVKQKVPLQYGQLIDPNDGLKHSTYYMTGPDGKLYSGNSADELVQHYKQLSAIPAPAPAAAPGASPQQSQPPMRLAPWLTTPQGARGLSPWDK